MKIESIPTSTKTEQDLHALAEAVQLALVTLVTLGDRLLHLERAVFGFERLAELAPNPAENEGECEDGDIAHFTKEAS